MTNSNVFGSRLLALRKRAGLNQKELGEAIGLSHKAISTIAVSYTHLTLPTTERV